MCCMPCVRVLPQSHVSAASLPCACPLDHSTLLFHLKHFPLDLRTLTCQLAFFLSNGRVGTGKSQFQCGSLLQPDLSSLSSSLPSGTECCPINWVEFGGSCYWFSRDGLTWAEADQYCQMENAHLLVINSREEQVRKSVGRFDQVA